ncbi:hypothetical protein MRB53_026839 [Persea americana]|uniref:Uncharacterized protein n=1 Tax=Persea americana TaxID=3435 RepID=A0ACC2LJF7_PERAE|nr:hypothetical protein MRB53_026839 [Persea americana]
MQFLKVEFHSTKPMPYGMNAFEYPATDPRFNNVFNKGMLNHTTIVMKEILETYKGFEGPEEVVDAGGGVGATLDALITICHTLSLEHLRLMSKCIDMILTGDNEVAKLEEGPSKGEDGGAGDEVEELERDGEVGEEDEEVEEDMFDEMPFRERE